MYPEQLLSFAQHPNAKELLMPTKYNIFLIMKLESTLWEGQIIWGVD